jgi:hypothetical protein
MLVRSILYYACRVSTPRIFYSTPETGTGKQTKSGMFEECTVGFFSFSPERKKLIDSAQKLVKHKIQEIPGHQLCPNPIEREHRDENRFHSEK